MIRWGGEMGRVATVERGVKVAESGDNTAAILHRIDELLRLIRQTSNHGEIVIRVSGGRVKVTGGPEIEYK